MRQVAVEIEQQKWPAVPVLAMTHACSPVALQPLLTRSTLAQACETPTPPTPQASADGRPRSS